MKKRHIRKVTVSGREYVWGITNNTDGDGGNTLKIWADKTTLIYEGLHTEQSITPKLISQIIKQSENHARRIQ